MMPTLVKAVVRFGWTMSIVQAWSPASLSVPRTSWEVTTVVTVKMLGLDARVRIEKALRWLVHYIICMLRHRFISIPDRVNSRLFWSIVSSALYVAA